MAVSGGDIYIAGYLWNSASIAHAGYWKNGIWIGLPSLDDIQQSLADSIVIDGLEEWDLELTTTT